MLRTPDNFQYARAAIRDIFYQMPTRTVIKDLWPRYLNEVIHSLGLNETNQAVKDLIKSGYLIVGKDTIKWKDPITYASVVSEGTSFKHEYGCLMLKLPIEDWDRILAMIDTDDIFDAEEHGLEYDPHTTVLFGFLESVTAEQLTPIIKNIQLPITLQLSGISHFECPDYDVVKFEVKSPYLTRIHELFTKLPHFSKFKDYVPHMTIAYVKKGTGAKYDHTFQHPAVVKAKTFWFTDKNKNSTLWNE